MKKRFFGVFLALMLVLAGTVGIAAPAMRIQKVYAAENKTRYKEEGGTYLGLFTETINYSYKEESFFIHKPGLPGYSSSLGCGIIAGTNIVSWYNRTYSGLIPGHTAGQYFWGNWMWATSNSYIAGVNSQLSSDMNAVNKGVTISGYLGGLNTYVTNKGRTFESVNMMGTGGLGNVLDQDYKEAIEDDGKLMTIFLDGFNIMSLGGVKSYESQGYDTVAMEEYTGAHIMVAYGFYEISYFSAPNTMFRQDIYLIVHTGFGGLLGMTRITANCTLDDAYITHIY